MSTTEITDIGAWCGQWLPDIRSLGTMMFDPVWAERPHRAHGCELLHVLGGRMTLHMGEARFVARPGDTLLVPEGVLHRDEFDLDEGLDILYGSFVWPPATLYFRAVTNDALLAIPRQTKAELCTLFDHMRQDLAGQGAEDRLVLRSRLLTVLLVIRRAVRAAQRNGEAARDPLYSKRRRADLMLRAREYLEQRYADCVSLAQIAEALEVSPYYLSHVFSEESDFSLFATLTTLRLEKARALLVAGEGNISEVARAVGYENANYFSKLFRKHCGCSPRQFAARHRRVGAATKHPK